MLWQSTQSTTALPGASCGCRVRVWPGLWCESWGDEVELLYPVSTLASPPPVPPPLAPTWIGLEQPHYIRALRPWPGVSRRRLTCCDTCCCGASYRETAEIERESGPAQDGAEGLLCESNSCHQLREHSQSRGAERRAYVGACVRRRQVTHFHSG